MDDSAVARLIVQRVVNDTKGLKVAGHAISAEDALEKLRTISPDLVILDIEMPGIGGIEAMPDIIRESGNAPILIVSSHCREGAEASIKAMAMGASDIVLKPDSPDANGRFAAVLTEKMCRLTDPLSSGKAPRNIAGRTAPTPSPHPVHCLAIGASTGGIHALSIFLSSLRDDVTAPILVTQHLPADFMIYFARQLSAISGRKAAPARDGQSLIGGEIVVAPGDAHLALQQHEGIVRVALDRSPMPSGVCPSVDVMLSSVAEIFGDTAVGVVLTGMGRDGAHGAEALARAGGEILAQDRESAVVWGMPGAVAEQGFASLVATPAELAAHIGQRERTVR
ncbi:chemotaxis-specific protein-glutamate methyltransferase CheB [Parasphingopyxis sp.]|uniref:chemotaxis-specific protein-glutamate methyltransferase CheB n=1 Tax=Parasphingopyxis sp. TaxID=1920299 RepID=UPI0026342380|nr:chemotaxis-specific protein-glutamate methyltransferase CheB [Parasphingopyxis sp.]